MATIPLIVGFGGINAAGRSSFHHSHRRMTLESCSAEQQAQTWQSLRGVTGRLDASDEDMAQASLIREITSDYFDHNSVKWNRSVPLDTGTGVQVEVAKKRMPEALPEGWRVLQDHGKSFTVEITGTTPAMFEDAMACDVGSAGMVPTGFDASKKYAARSHPRGVQLGVYAATDALGSMGIDWSVIESTVRPDQVSVYSGSCLGQLDSDGFGGLWARQRGKRVTSKNMPLGLAEMPADFINAYILGTLGGTGLVMGACATFHYNLRAAVIDMMAGRCKVAIVGAAEAAINPEVIDGFTTMGALGTKQNLAALDGLSEPDLRRACRPFGENCGFTIAEGAQTVILMADDLAETLGTQVYGAVADVFVNADGFKKSVSGPGIGNHITVAKAAGLVRSLLGEDALRSRSFVHAHGTGTPQNRVTESQIFSQVAQAFGIERWPVAAIKSYVGHTLAAAGGDQVVSALGTWNSGVIPAIATVDKLADDVHTAGLEFAINPMQRDAGALDAALLNAKGFGGNNATSVLLAPHVAKRLLNAKYGKQAVASWQQRSEQAQAQAQAYDTAALKGEAELVYKFDNNVRSEQHVDISADELSVEGYDVAVSLGDVSPLQTYLKD